MTRSAAGPVSLPSRHRPEPIRWRNPLSERARQKHAAARRRSVQAAGRAALLTLALALAPEAAGAAAAALTPAQPFLAKG